MTPTLHDEPTAPVAGHWRYAVWLLLGLLVVAHGCHGAKDTELSLTPRGRVVGVTPGG
jgi:hypothetical protein